MASPTTPGLITTSATAPMSTAVAALPTRLTLILLPTTRLPRSARRSRPTSIATAQTGKRPLMARTTATLDSMSRSATGSSICPNRVGPALLASLPSRKSVSAARTKNAAASPSDPASSSATTTGTMKSRSKDKALGTVNTRSLSLLASSVPGIPLTAALNPYPYAYPPQIIPFPEGVLHVAQVGIGQVFGPVGEEGEARGRGAGLGRVPDLDALWRGVATDDLVYELRDFVGRDAQVVGAVEPGGKGEDLIHALAGERGDSERGWLQVGHAGEELAFDLPDSLPGHEVLLVYEYPARRAGLFYLARDREVAAHKPVHGVYEEQRDLGAPDGLGRPQGGVVGHAARASGGAAHSCGVEHEEAHRFAVHLHLDLAGDSVGSGARLLGDDRPFRAEQAVQKSALAHVGTANDGEPRQPFFLVRLRLRQQRDDLVEEVSDPDAVQRRDRVRLAFA